MTVIDGAIRSHGDTLVGFVGDGVESSDPQQGYRLITGVLRILNGGAAKGAILV